MGLAAGESGLVAVGTDGVSFPNPESSAAVWTSQDGVSWIRVQGRALRGQGEQAINGVAFGETGFVAAGWEFTGDPSALTFNRDAAVWTSPDGESWERVADPEGVFGGPSHEVVVDDRGRGSERFVVPSFQGMWDVAAGGPGFVAVGVDDLVGRDDETRRGPTQLGPPRHRTPTDPPPPPNRQLLPTTPRNRQNQQRSTPLYQTRPRPLLLPTPPRNTNPPLDNIEASGCRLRPRTVC